VQSESRTGPLEHRIVPEHQPATRLKEPRSIGTQPKLRASERQERTLQLRRCPSHVLDDKRNTQLSEKVARL
jgi:hypothetical protein